MVPPVKGDYTTIDQVMNAQARKAADSWEPSMDGRCEAYGVGGVMRLPGRLRISWQDDSTLKIETDAGAQTRLLRFAAPAPNAAPGPRTLQGYSTAEWQLGGGQRDAFLERGVGPSGGAQRWGGLTVVTTNTNGGWLVRTACRMERGPPSPSTSPASRIRLPATGSSSRPSSRIRNT